MDVFPVVTFKVYLYGIKVHIAQIGAVFFRFLRIYCVILLRLLRVCYIYRFREVLKQVVIKHAEAQKAADKQEHIAADLNIPWIYQKPGHQSSDYQKCRNYFLIKRLLRIVTDLKENRERLA